MKTIYYKDFDYKSLHIYHSLKKRGFKNDTFCPLFIMADTETSRKDNQTHDNHIVAFSIALRYQGQNICCLYGYDPVEFIDCVNLLHDNLAGEYLYIYFHNLAYDFQFLRKFLFKEFGFPKRELNTKTHYPIYIEFGNGITFRDSLILAQRNLEKWADDLDVEHKKAIGKWNYDIIRNQHEKEFTEDEILYISNDVLSGVECLESTAKMLHKNVASMPWTATGIPREEITKISKKYKAHEDFLRMAPSYELYLKMEQIFHGGYTHGNRYYYNSLITEDDGGLIECYDFSSSYPFCLLAFRYPCSKFVKTSNKTIQKILSLSEKYAFLFKLILVNPKLKNYKHTVMPVLQLSKCTKVINPILDNGRILEADYIEIMICELDLMVIENQYEYELHLCIDVYYAHKDYLPRYFTDYIYSLYVDKCRLKGANDPVLYNIQKSKLNSIYGLCATHCIHSEITENYETGEYEINHNYSEETYNKYVNRKKSFLPYVWGIYTTGYALLNLMKLGDCIDYDSGGFWIYSDTDSIYAIGMDKKKVADYNKSCIEKLSRNGYSGVTIGDKIYHLGIAEHEGTFKEFKFTGAKRYCKRTIDGKLIITVAGVPKKGVECLKDDINNFRPGYCFDGLTTGKLQHEYLYVNEIYQDEKGNITGDSINLSPCDYMLDSEQTFDIYEYQPGYYEDD